MSRPTALAPVRVGSRKIRNGTRGIARALLDRDERRDQDAAEIASRTIVSVDPQPAFSALTIA